MSREVTNAIFLVACDYLRGEDSGYDIHDGLLWDMAVDATKAINALGTPTENTREWEDPIGDIARFADKARYDYYKPPTEKP